MHPAARLTRAPALRPIAPQPSRRHPPSPTRPHLPPPAAGFGGFGKPKPAKTKPAQRLPPWIADKGACPCCSGRRFADCCAPYLAADAPPPPTAEALMRSRFAAYVTGGKDGVNHVVRTTHPDNPAASGSKRPDGTPASTLEQDVRATMKRVAWQRLRVDAVEGGKEGDETGRVSFTAWYKITGQLGSRADGGDAVGTMVETSDFVRDGEGGQWLYRGGVVTMNGVARDDGGGGL